MATWYCVAETRDDYGHVTARLVDVTDADEKPEDMTFGREDDDLCYTWYNSLEAAESAIADALREV